MRPAASRSAQNVLNIVKTASATTTTASSFKPLITPLNPCPAPGARVASQYSNRKEGVLKPIKAATAPARPARRRPMQKPIWLEPGPGKN